MIKKFFLIFLASLCLQGFADEKPLKIKVLIAKESPGVLLEVRGAFQAYNPLNQVPVASSNSGGRFYMRPYEEGIFWGKKYPYVFQIKIAPENANTSVLIDGVEYKGSIEVYDINNTINVVNEISVEDYLKSTLSSQFPEDPGLEVMNALAIIARTNAYHTILKDNSAYWQIDSKDSLYTGYAPTVSAPHVCKAVDNTIGAILTINNNPFVALWTEDSAGYTAAASSIFRKEVLSTPGVHSPIAAKDKEKRKWIFTIERSELASILNLPSIQKIDSFTDKKSKKVYAVRFSGEERFEDVDFFTLQKIFGSDKILSNNLNIEVKDNLVVFSGYGKGHGVGMCLYSAQAMAKYGKKASNILSAFFPGAHLDKISKQ